MDVAHGGFGVLPEDSHDGEMKVAEACGVDDSEGIRASFMWSTW
ncbi:MAG: hypothetical protein VYE73_07930 [Acidobacteriota bacterium]|nr:hypothetical protein [Acidobacteriota bacterium]